MAIGIKRDLKDAIKAAAEEVSSLARGGGKYAQGLASEGFMGGYLEALRDVQLATNGVEPRRWRQWREIAFERRLKAGGKDA